MNHPDSDGVWPVKDLPGLESELSEIEAGLERLPSQPFLAGWPRRTAQELSPGAMNLGESFIDVDGEPLVARLLSLVRTALTENLPIWFQRIVDGEPVQSRSVRFRLVSGSV